MQRDFEAEKQEYFQGLIDAGLPDDVARNIADKTIKTIKQKAESASVTEPEPVSSASPEKPAKKKEKKVKKEGEQLAIDYRRDAMPSWVKEVIDTHLLIEEEDAKKAGTVSFLARAMVIASMPYREQKRADGTPSKEYSRINGNFRLEILGANGVPYGIYPRLLLSWVTTEAVKNQSPIIHLGDSLREFLRDVLDIKSTSGGERGSGVRVVEQMRRLFSAMITAEYTNAKGGKGFALKNILIANEVQLTEEEILAIEAIDSEQQAPSRTLWTPQQAHEAGAWESKLVLSDPFFKECTSSPVPIDLRAYKALRRSPLAMDIYSWMTYRMSYLKGNSRPIPWESLMLQFGSSFASATAQDPTRDVRNFKMQFLKALNMVAIIYPDAKFFVQDNGLVLQESATHIPKILLSEQSSLF